MKPLYNYSNPRKFVKLFHRPVSTKPTLVIGNNIRVYSKQVYGAGRAEQISYSPIQDLNFKNISILNSWVPHIAPPAISKLISTWPTRVMQSYWTMAPRTSCMAVWVAAKDFNTSGFNLLSSSSSFTSLSYKHKQQGQNWYISE